MPLERIEMPKSKHFEFVIYMTNRIRLMFVLMVMDNEFGHLPAKLELTREMR